MLACWMRKSIDSPWQRQKERASERERSRENNVARPVAGKRRSWRHKIEVKRSNKHEEDATHLSG